MRQLGTIAALQLLNICIIISPAIVAAEEADVRILIDVSGSMKANDPQNLRIPAVRLVAELMPPGAVAGIWTFSERVEQLVAPTVVDAKWKSTVKKAIQGIHSRGLFTDVEAALQAATRDWSGTQDNAPPRHVILLTDGMVDVSKQAAQSVASRKRILDTELARIKGYGAQVHTIALSANSDRELMTVLAETTEGWAEQVDDAASLQRVFLHMFEQAAAPDAIPLLDNRFEIDGSISEMTLLVFRGETTEPLRLVDPAGADIVEQGHRDNVSWRVEAGYDLVTVSSPAAGTWQINTDPDPDNRVLIVTDLKLELDPLPTNVLADETLKINAYISEGGRLLKRADFLKLVQAELLVSGAGVGMPETFPIPLDSSKARFLDEPKVAWQPGDYEFVVRVDGGTFQREHRSKLRIHGAPLSFASAVQSDGVSVVFTARAAPELVSLDSLAGLLVVENPDGSSQVLDLPEFSTAEIAFPIATPQNGIYRIEPRVFGESASGRTLSVKSTPLLAEITAGAVPDAPLEAQQVNDVPAPSIDWMHTGAIVLVGNATIGTLLAAVWFFFGRRKLVPSSQVVVQ